GNIPEPYWRAAGLRSNRYDTAPLYPEALARAQEQLLKLFENNGYPFARIYLDSLTWTDAQAISAYCFVDRGPLVLFDELKLEGDVKISNAYLESYLGIRAGMPYSREKVLRMRERLQELAFLQEKKDPAITFWRDKALLTLFLERKKASRFDFLLGVLPTDQFSGKRVLITGVLNAALQNQFGLGETLLGRFEQLRPGTQELEIAFSYPYVLQLPFGVDVSFEQYRRDSTFNDVIFDLGLRYLLEGGNYLKAFWNRTNSGLLSVNENQIINNRSLPENLDILNTRLGLEYHLSQVDYRRNPRKGWQLLLQGSIGFKNISPNTQILELEDPQDPAFDFATLYDTLTLSSTQYRGHLSLAGFLPLFNSMTVMGRFQGGYIGADQPIYKNEQYRIGGSRLLRGFDEEAIFSTVYGVLTLEYRLLLDRNSYIYLFSDFGYIEDITATSRRFDRPLGFGGGLTFDTKAGLFGISLALGRQQENPFDFRNPKIHFGYVSFF
ncbi:MAG: BamA/TamA family outer membrane protein, partial [Phaeodactylibacter sp.]|nr:BamA/TamA family outer membrane protein [Phaeodactylibacter sp.]